MRRILGFVSQMKRKQDQNTAPNFQSVHRLRGSGRETFYWLGLADLVSRPRSVEGWAPSRICGRERQASRRPPGGDRLPSSASFKLWGVGCWGKVLGLGFGAKCLGVKVQGLGIRDLGFGFQGLGLGSLEVSDFRGKPQTLNPKP